MNRKSFVPHLIILLFFVSLLDASSSLGLQQMLLSNNVNISFSGSVSYSNATTNPFGVQVWWHLTNTTFALERAKNLGAGWIRIDTRWDHREPSKGVYDWSAPSWAEAYWDGALYGTGFDAMVKITKLMGMKPLLVVPTYTPAWARGDVGSYTDPSNDVNDYRDFINVLVTRYELDVIEIGNEPTNFFTGTPQQYVEMIRAGREGAKAANPNIYTISGYGWGGTDDIDGRFGLSVLQQYNFLDYCDAIAVHPYTWDNAPETYLPPQFDELRQWFSNNGLPMKPLWATEFGDGQQWHTAEQQADWTKRTLQVLWEDPDVVFYNYFCLWGSGSWDLNLVEDEATLTPRPVYYTYQEFIATHTT